jgi:hypothetical protein
LSVSDPGNVLGVVNEGENEVWEQIGKLGMARVIGQKLDEHSLRRLEVGNVLGRDERELADVNQ